MMNPYYYLFYIIYKFIKLTTKEELQDHVPPSAHALFFICLTNNYIAIIISTHAIKFLSSNLILFGIVFSIVPITLYFVNKHLFISDEKYLAIERKYDELNRLTKTHFILLTVLYIVVSIGFMIWAGINYNK